MVLFYEYAYMQSQNVAIKAFGWHTLSVSL